MPLTIKRVIKVFQTDSKPYLVEASDGQEYVLKHTAARPDYIGLAKELIVSNLGMSLGLPMPAFELIEVTSFGKKLFEAVGKKNNSPFPEEGIWFASKVVLNSFSLFEPPEKAIEKRKIVNEFDVGSGVGLDSLLHNSDRNSGNVLFVQDSTPKSIRFYLIDHARCFGGLIFPPSETTTANVELVNDLEFITYVSLTKLIKEHGSRIIGKIDQTMIENAFVNIPITWKIKSSDILCMKSFLKDRISKTQILLGSK